MVTLLDKQKIIVAGGTSGIGLSLVKMLAAEGAAITAMGRDGQKLKALEKEAPGVRAVELDARDRAAADRFFSQEKEIGHLVLCLSGAKGGGNFTTLDLGELREGFEGKFWPQLQLAQAALSSMRKDGSITFVTAASSTARLPGTSGLAAINGAIELMVPILSRELKPMRVNAVSPGVIDTSWWDFLPADAKRQVFSDFSGQVNIGRVGRPEEVAAVIKMIIMTEYVNGVVIGCHGGLG